MKTMVINGMEFDVIKPRKSEKVDFMVDRCLDCQFLDLDSYYKQPSAAKRAIWEVWREWYCSADYRVSTLCVISANSQTFTISALYSANADNKIDGVFVITKSYNRLYLY